MTQERWRMQQCNEREKKYKRKEVCCTVMSFENKQSVLP